MYMYNLSSFKLNVQQLGLLKKALSFTPIPKFDAFTLIKDMSLFVRKVSFYKLHLNRSWDPDTLKNRARLSKYIMRLEKERVLKNN